MKEQQTAPLTTEELTEKYHKLRRTFILATVISIFGTIVMLPSVLFFKIPYALAGALVLLTDARACAVDPRLRRPERDV